MRKVYLCGLLLLMIILASCGHSDRSVLIFEGASMAPTIYDEDRIVVNEAYYDKHEVQRGEIVMYETEDHKLYVKRVLGLPGEEIQMKSGQILANDEPVSKEFIFQEVQSEGFEMALGDNEYFVLGDAMDMSRDSRHIGPIMKEDIIGKVVIIKSE